MDRHAFKNQEFLDMVLESDSHVGLGTPSFCKGAANEASLELCLMKLKSEDGGNLKGGESCSGTLT